MNLPTKKKLSVIEREGVNYVRTIIENANCIFNEIDQRNDFGVDAIIELVDNEKVTGKNLAIQIKSGKSYCDRSLCKITSTKKHFNYWINHSLTIIGVVYDPKEKMAYWVDISRILKHDRKRLEKGPYTITFEKREINLISPDGLIDFFLPGFLKKPINLDYDRSIRFAKSDDFDMHQIGLSSLLNNYRQLNEVWDLFFDLFINSPIKKISGYLIYIISLIPGHPDIYWHSGNTINEELRRELAERLKEINHNFFIKLLFFVDENGFGRGSLGQSIEAIISLNQQKESILKKISFDKRIDLQIRKNSLMLLTFYTQKLSVPLLHELIQTDNEIKEFAQYLKSSFDEHGYINIF